MRTNRKLWVGAAVAAVAMAGLVLARDGLASRGGAGDGPRLAVDLSKNRLAEAALARSNAEAAARPTWQGSRFGIARELRELPADDPERVEHAALAELLSSQSITPPERYAQFRALDTPEYRWDGWRGSIVSVERTPGGAVVDLRVEPVINFGQGSTCIVFATVERYQVGVDGGVRYRDAIGAGREVPRHRHGLIPKGAGGQGGMWDLENLFRFLLPWPTLAG